MPSCHQADARSEIRGYVVLLVVALLIGEAIAALCFLWDRHLTHEERRRELDLRAARSGGPVQ